MALHPSHTYSRCLNFPVRALKNRSEGFQPLPRSLVARLHAYAQSGEPEALYARSYARRDAKLKAPANPLLYVPSSLSRDFDKDLRAAGIPKRTAAGKVDFHACRTAYINLVMENATTEKELQELARHATPHMTLNVYGRVREGRLAETVEKVAERVRSERNHAHSMQRQAVGAEIENATPLENTELRIKEHGGAEGNRTPFPCSAQRRRIPAERREVKAVQRVSEIA
jgi:hypothetical protein